MEIDFSDTLNLEFNLGKVNPLHVEFEGGSPTGGAINVIKVNGVTLPIVNYTVDIPVPTKTSQLNNDNDFVSDPNYHHTDNNFTNVFKNKLNSLHNQVYIGDEQPSDDYVLIWVETSSHNAMLTSDGKLFMTSDNKEFVVADGIPLFTSDNKEFYEATNKQFITKGEI